MAGKTKKRGNPSPNNATPRSGRRGESPLKGHLGLKSSAFAPTDCKLVSQYLVVDHMSAHYKKLHTVKSAIDNTPPRAWLTSQKMRDRARRNAMMSDLKRREDWLESSPRAPMSAHLSRASSECDRDEMLAMMESHYNNADYDEVDGSPPRKSQIPNGDDMKLIEEMVNDSHKGPSSYHSPRKMASNIPSQHAKHGRMTQHRAVSAPSPYRTRQIEAPYNDLNTTSKQPNSARNPRTPREGGDLLETHSHKFNEEKPFQPRTLKGKNTAKSKLSEFKYYNPPKRSKEKEDARPTTSKSMRSVVSRPETPMTFNTENSMELMNETLMSRDNSHPSPGFVPPLDISLDADNAKWLKEQSRKAYARKSGRTISNSGAGGGSGLRGTKILHDTKRNGLRSTQRVSALGRTTSIEESSKERPMTSRYPSSLTMYKVETAEEDLKYLEFENDVTRDILDRGICTNRVLKQVFEAHIEARKKDLKVSKMREMLEDLRRKLGVPPEEDDDFEGVGLKSTVPYNLDEPTNPHAFSNGSYDVASDMDHLSMADGRDVKAAQRRMKTTELHVNSTMNPMLTTQTFKNSMRDGRPPLPRPGSRGKSRRGSGNSSVTSMTVREESFEKIDNALEEEVFEHDLNANPNTHSIDETDAQPHAYSSETSVYGVKETGDMLGTLKPEKMSETKADILTIHQIDEDAETQSDDELDDTLRGEADGYKPETKELNDKTEHKEEQQTARTSSYEPETDRTDYDADFEDVYAKQTQDINQEQSDGETYREDENEDDHDDDDDDDEDDDYDDEPPSLQARPEPPKASPPKPSPRKRTSVTSISSSKNQLSDSEEWTGGDTNRSKVESLGTTRDTEMDSESIVVSELTQGDEDNDEF